MTLPGPTIDGASSYRLSRPSFFVPRYELRASTGGAPVGVLDRERRLGPNRAVVGEVTATLRPIGATRSELEATDPASGETLVHVAPGAVSGAGERYGWASERRGTSVPWVLSADGQEVASFALHVLSRRGRMEIETTGARPVPILLVLVLCQAIIARQQNRS